MPSPPHAGWVPTPFSWPPVPEPTSRRSGSRTSPASPASATPNRAPPSPQPLSVGRAGVTLAHRRDPQQRSDRRQARGDGSTMVLEAAIEPVDRGCPAGKNGLSFEIAGEIVGEERRRGVASGG